MAISEHQSPCKCGFRQRVWLVLNHVAILRPVVSYCEHSHCACDVGGLAKEQWDTADCLCLGSRRLLLSNHANQRTGMFRTTTVT